MWGIRRATTSTRRRWLSAAGVGLAMPLLSRVRGMAGPLAVPPAAPTAPGGMKLGCQQGPTTDELLRFLARHGVRNICGSLAARQTKGAYTVEELRRSARPVRRTTASAWT